MAEEPPQGIIIRVKRLRNGRYRAVWNCPESDEPDQTEKTFPTQDEALETAWGVLREQLAIRQHKFDDTNDS
jgi:hypothetical protein